MKKTIRKYGDNSSFLADNSRPLDLSFVGQVSDDAVFKGVNVVVEALPQNCRVKDMLIYDKQELKHKILKMKTYDASTFDTSRYIKSNFLWHRNVLGTGLFIYSGQTSAPWGAQCEFTLSNLDLTQSGSFDFLSTGYQAKATATTISWEAGAAIADIVAQLSTGNGNPMGSSSFSNRLAENDTIVFMVGGYGTNNITISNATGGATGFVLTDYSKYCKVNGVELTGDPNEIHRSFQGSTVATCFPGFATELLPVTSASYTKTNVNRPYRCGQYFPKFKSYVYTGGSSSFVDDTTAGSTFPMTYAKFMACASSEVEAEVACYNRYNGNYDDYLRAAMADDDSLLGTVGHSEQDFGKQGKLLASIFYKNRNNVWCPCYPAAYAANQMGVTVEGYTTGFEPGNAYLPGSFEGVSFMKEGTVEALNEGLASVGGTALGSSDLWFSSEYDANLAWLYYAYGGTLDYNGKMYSSGVRAGLAFKFNLNS